MENSKRKNKIIYIVLGIIAIAILYSYFFTNYPKKLYKTLKKQYLAEQSISQKQLDSIEAVRISAYEDYQKQIDQMTEMYENQLLLINQELDQEIKKNIRNERELNSYRDGDFHERFDVFSKTYNSKN